MAPEPVMTPSAQVLCLPCRNPGTYVQQRDRIRERNPDRAVRIRSRAVILPPAFCLLMALSPPPCEAVEFLVKKSTILCMKFIIITYQWYFVKNPKYRSLPENGSIEMLKLPLK